MHRNPDWDKYIGKIVQVKLKDGHSFTGLLDFVDEFSAKYDYRKPDYYSLTLLSGAGYVSFRKGLVNSISLYT